VAKALAIAAFVLCNPKLHKNYQYKAAFGSLFFLVHLFSKKALRIHISFSYTN
jgi:hypothetical protein